MEEKEDTLGDGEGGRIGSGDGGPLMVELVEVEGGTAFFFPVKGRRNDHCSDSNWTDSNSDPSDE